MNARRQEPTYSVFNVFASYKFDDARLEAGYEKTKALGDYGCKIVVFFFQAEDGIRDLTVTGVQTCALPICNRTALRGSGRALTTSPERARGARASASTSRGA